MKLTTAQTHLVKILRSQGGSAWIQTDTQPGRVRNTTVRSLVSRGVITARLLSQDQEARSMATWDCTLIGE